MEKHNRHTAYHHRRPAHVVRSFRVSRKLLLQGGLLAVFVGLVIGAYLFLQRLPTRTPEIWIEGVEDPIRMHEVQQQISENWRGKFWRTSLDPMLFSLEKLSWVDWVSIHRVWPNRFYFSVQERRPVAWWGNAWVDHSGHVFTPRESQHNGVVLHLGGDVAHAPQVVQMCLELSHELSLVGLKVAHCEQQKYGGFRIDLSQGTQLQLGATNQVEATRRFIVFYRSVLQHSTRHAATVDLRYPHGLAVQWSENNFL